MLKKCITLILLVQISFTIAQQNSKTDSLLNVVQTNPNDSLKINALGRLFYGAMQTSPDKAKAYAFQALDIANGNHNLIEQQAMSNYHIATYYYYTVKMDSAKHYYLQSLDICKKLNDPVKEARIGHALAILEYAQANYDPALKITDRNIELFKDTDSLSWGVMYDFKSQVLSSKGNLDEALTASLKAIKILEAVGNKFRTGDAYNHLGEVETKLSNFENAVHYYNKGLEYFKSINHTISQAIILSSLGNAHIQLNDYSSAISTLKESITLAKQVQHSNVEAIAKTYLAQVYELQNNYTDAIKLLEESVHLQREAKADNELAAALTSLGKVHISNNEPSKAISYLNESININTRIGSKDLLSEAYLQRSLAYEKLNKSSNALSDFKAHSILKDTLFDSKKSKQIETLRAAFDTEKKEQQIALQENEIIVLEKNTEIINLQKLLLGVGLLLSLIAIGFGFYGFTQKAKRNKAEKAKLDNELEFKKKELTTHALHLAKKNEVLEDLKQKAEILKTEDQNNKGYQQLIKAINFDLQDDKNWDNFTRYFEEVHQGFSTKAQQQFPDITANDLRLMALLKMNLTSKEIANILSISSEGIKKARYRLRKKLHLSTEDSLEDFVLAFV